MMKRFILLALVLFVSGCTGIKLVSDYDEVIDVGITEFAEQFNTHVKNMADFAGTPEGTYEDNVATYNALEAKLDVMIARASSASQGMGCKLEQEVFDRVEKLLQNDIPADMQSEETASTGNPSGCNERLLVLVKDQLLSVRKIHRELDKCGNPQVSCLRPATVASATKIVNQSINAVSVVENAKKQ